MRFAVIASAAGALAAVALTSAAVASATPDDDFLSVLASNGVSWPTASPQTATEAGRAVCKAWSSGKTYAQEVVELTTMNNWTSTEAGIFIGAATGSFCPEYSNRIR